MILRLSLQQNCLLLWVSPHPMHRSISHPSIFLRQPATGNGYHKRQKLLRGTGTEKISEKRPINFPWLPDIFDAPSLWLCFWHTHFFKCLRSRGSFWCVTRAVFLSTRARCLSVGTPRVAATTETSTIASKSTTAVHCRNSMALIVLAAGLGGSRS